VAALILSDQVYSSMVLMFWVRTFAILSLHVPSVVTNKLTILVVRMMRTAGFSLLALGPADAIVYTGRTPPPLEYLGWDMTIQGLLKERGW